MQHNNSLSQESSPYLLQHAQNPVAWHAWSDSVFELAQKENKLILISIGYSTCHWCHVMEKESFENEEVAQFMNTHFINVKVDREEHPDVDKVYMNAVQIMTGKGGWPLNCFALPDGTPVYGGTYFPTQQWLHILNSLAQIYSKTPEKMLEYGEQLKSGLVQSRDGILLSPRFQHQLEEQLHETIKRWKPRLDFEWGGLNRAPKFPLPSNIDFQLMYASYFSDSTLEEYTFNTLNQMAFGGIFDHLDGGFSRYSVDHEWKLPHFEKMLYDNAQLLISYADAYRLQPSPLYKTVIDKTFNWLQEQMLDANGGYYSALDADTEGVEGKFYVWTLEELKNCLGERFEEAAYIFDFSQNAHWENGNYVLRRNNYVAYTCQALGISFEELEEKVAELTELLNQVRCKRISPGLDHKQLTTWNALLLKAFCHCYLLFKDEKFNTAAKRLFTWFQTYVTKDNKVFRVVTNNVSKLDGTLDDYTFLMDAFTYYAITFKDQSALDQVQLWIEKIDADFIDASSGLYYFTEEKSNVFYRDIDVSDNVLPCANSVIANVFIHLAILKDDHTLLERSQNMLQQVLEDIPHYGSAYSNWALLMMKHHFGMKKLKINRSLSLDEHVDCNFMPNVFVCEDTQIKTSLLCSMHACSPINLLEDGWIEKCRY